MLLNFIIMAKDYLLWHLELFFSRWSTIEMLIDDSVTLTHFKFLCWEYFYLLCFVLFIFYSD